MTPTESAILVEVPAAEAAVARFRARLDTAAVAAISDIVAGCATFDLVMNRIEWFGEEVVWVAPAHRRAVGRARRTWRMAPGPHLSAQALTCTDTGGATSSPTQQSGSAHR